MGEYLFDTPIFRATMTPAMEREANLFRGECPNESKEDTMPKTINQPAIANFESITNESKEDTVTNAKTAAKTTANDSKETIMTENATPKTFAAKKSAATKLREKYIDEIRKATPAEGVTSCLPGKGINNLTDDPEERELLAKAATFFDMGTAFCTESQAKKFGGVLKEDEQGWLVFWKAKTTKAGKTSQWSSVVYPVNAFEWEDGEPVFDEDADLKRKARRAARAAKKAAAALKAANEAAGIKTTKRRTTTSKAKAAAPAIAAAPAQMLHIKLPNGLEFDARDAAEVKELMALFA